MSGAKEYLEKTLKHVVDMQGQDVIMKVGVVPRIRIGREVNPAPMEPLSEAFSQEFVKIILQPKQQDILEKNKSIDFAFALEGSEQRFRGNIFYQQGMLSFVFRKLWRDIPSFDALRVPPILQKIALSRSGIILVAGVVASGKTTTINAMIEMINQSLGRHIITLEDPLEYLHSDKKCVINQREVGQDTDDFHSALKYVVRQSPDVVVIGEMRDAETFHFALSSAEVGRLVIATVHARSVTQIFDRVLGFFPPDQRDTVLAHLYPNITCFVVQQLLMAKDGKTLVPAVEVMTGNFTTRQLVKEKKFDKLQQAMRNSGDEGMQTMDQSIHGLWKQGLISTETALAAADRPQELENQMKGISLDGQSSKILGG